MTFEQAAESFAKAYGLKYEGGIFSGGRGFWGWGRLPKEKDAFSEQMFFVGRIAMLVGKGVQLGFDPKQGACVSFDERVAQVAAPDICWAALLAATAAKGAT